MSRGFPTKKILTNMNLLAESVNSLDRQIVLLLNMGVGMEKIITNPQLLNVKEERLKSNYDRLTKNFSADFINTYAPILGFRPKTVEDNLVFLNDLGLDSRYNILYLANVETKRKKIIFIAELLYGTDVHKINKIDIFNTNIIIRKNPKLLTYSMQTLEKIKPKIMTLGEGD
jgi:hypothetical protein